ncbi:MAG: hypothetical protein AAB038_00605 [Planctomycetota bacterium]
MKLPRKSWLIILILGVFGLGLIIALLVMNQQVAGKYSNRIFSIDDVAERQVGWVSLMLQEVTRCYIEVTRGYCNFL